MNEYRFFVSHIFWLMDQSSIPRHIFVEFICIAFIVSSMFHFYCIDGIFLLSNQNKVPKMDMIDMNNLSSPKMGVLVGMNFSLCMSVVLCIF